MDAHGRGQADPPALSEDDLLAAIRKLLSGEGPGVEVGVGDDAAVVELGKHPLVLTTDLLVEGVHFDRALSSPHDLGYKALSVNVSDVAAMGGSPRVALVGLAVRAPLEGAFVMELYGGLLEAGEEYAVSVVGGDTSRGEGVVISVTVVGEVAKGQAVLRSGASAGDRLVVTGTLGGAAGGLRVARAGPSGAHGALGTAWARVLLERHARPVARVGEGQTLAQAGATAMIDVSDGLALDLSRLCAESGVGARVAEGSVPVEPALLEGASVVGVDPLELALSGGEDYELLATIAPEAVEGTARKLVERFGTPLTDIGEVTEEGLRIVDPDGRERELEPRGWDHFA